MITAFIFTFLYLITWVFFQKYQFIERDNKAGSDIRQNANKRWHQWKAANQVVFFLLLVLISSVKIAILSSIIFWIFFDALLNKIALNKPLLYVGKTSYLDVNTRRLADILHIDPTHLSLILKILIIVLIILLF
jgi:hypothetical protein